MNEQEKSGQGMETGTLFIIIFLLFAAAFFNKSKPRLLFFWHIHHSLLVALFFFLVIAATLIAVMYLWNHYVDRCYKKAVTSKDDTSVYLGTDEDGKKVHLRQSFRTSHTQVIGTTNAGKTESVILPWIIKDTENGSGLLIVDGKSDASFLDKLYAYVVKNNREKDFKLFSLVHIKESTPFNPFIGGTPEEATERVFSAFPIEHSHYKAIQSKIFLALVTLVTESKAEPTFSIIHRLLTDPEYLGVWVNNSTNETIKRVLNSFLKLPDRERLEQISGLEAHLSPFAFGSHSELFNATKNVIRFDEALAQNQICYFQLPTMLYPFLGEATGKLVLQSFQSAVARRQVTSSKKGNFFSCYLDDFQDYIYKGFGSLLNKSRSANVGVVFSHQALGDLEKVGDDFKNVVLTNTNIKIIMRNNDPDTCEHFAKTFGTRTTEKATERRTKSLFGDKNTGEGSVREVEEYIYHPNKIRQLGTGEGIVAIPHPKGVKAFKIKFAMRHNLASHPLPIVIKNEATASTPQIIPEVLPTRM